MYTSHMKFKKMAVSSILCMELFYLAVLAGASLHSSTNVHEQKRANSDWHDCSTTHNFVKVVNYTLSPNPLIRGKAFNIRATIKIYKKFDWAIMHLTVKHALHGLNVTIVDEKLNFCDFCVEALHRYCPILPGIYHMNDTNYVPGLFWTGLYNAKAVVYTENGDEMFCGETTAKLSLENF